MAIDDYPQARLGASIAGAVVGGALVGYGGRGRDGRSRLSRLFGLACVAGAVVPELFHQLVSAGAARRGVHIRTTLLLDLPVHDVFRFCHDFENFPRIVHSLKHVDDFQDGRSHWTVSTPSGDVVEFDALVTKYVPNTVIAWHSIPGSTVDCKGTLRFAPTTGGGTRVDVEISYDPRHTGLSQALHALIDERPEEQLRADLERANAMMQQL